MKRAIYIILLLLYTTLVHAHMYQSNMSTYQPQTKIGYTTNYSNGQFTPSAYQNLNTSTYSGTYNPYFNGNANNGGSGRPGVRKVKGYDDNGNETGSSTSGPEQGTWIGRGESFWEDGYTYYYNESKDRWYREDDEGNVSEWDNLLGWHWTLLYGHTIPSGSIQGYQYPPTQIGDAIVPLLLLMFAYLSYHEIKKRRHCKHFFLCFFL